MQNAAIIGIVLLWAVSMFQLLLLFRYPGQQSFIDAPSTRGWAKLRIVSKVSTSLLLILMYYYLWE